LDPDKDQSYFLYGLTQPQLGSADFPVGEKTKPEVREYARQRGLPVASRPESQEICFIPDNNYAGFLSERLPDLAQPGPIVDREGTVLGQHPGIIHFTVGQRRGIGLAAPHPLYVLEIQARDNTIVVGPNKELYKAALLAGRLNWIAWPRIDRPLRGSARIRYKHKETPANIIPLPGEKVSVEFDRPQRAVTPGQSVVFYDGDVVLGGGIIEAPLN
jgi:tRNA-specific 2-thiouridylase